MIETRYITTDLDLKSECAFDLLHGELSSRCLVLHYGQGDDGYYYARYEADDDCESSGDIPEREILLILDALESLSDDAKLELANCSLREFNMGFDCGDSWGHVHAVPHNVLASVANSGCSIAVTLYPMRHPDGTPRVDDSANTASNQGESGGEADGDGDEL